MQIYTLNYYKQSIAALNTGKSNELYGSLKTDEVGKYFLWSYYDVLVVSNGTSGENTQDQGVCPALRHDACFFEYGEKSQALFSNQANEETPLLCIFQFAINPQFMRKYTQELDMSSSLDQESFDIRSAHNAMERLSSEINNHLFSKAPPIHSPIKSAIMGTLGSEDFALVMRSASYYSMMKVTDRLRGLSCDSMFDGKYASIPGKLAASDAVILGIDPKAFQKNTIRQAWQAAEDWDKLKIIFDIKVTNSGDKKTVEGLFASYDNKQSRSQVIPQYGKYTFLVEYKPHEGSPDFFRNLYFDNSFQSLTQAGIDLIQTHWMLNAVDTDDSPAGEAGESDVNDKRLIQMHERIKVAYDEAAKTKIAHKNPALLRMVTERIWYLCFRLPEHQTWSLMEQLIYLLEILKEDALRRAVVRKKNPKDGSESHYTTYVNALLTYTNQVEQGSQASPDCFSANPFYYGSRTKILQGYAGFFDDAAQAAMASMRSVNRQLRFFPIIDMSETLNSISPFSHVNDMRISIIRVPAQDMYHFLTDFDIYQHEIFHYVPPEQRKKRNRHCLRLILSLFLDSELYEQIGDLLINHLTLPAFGPAQKPWLKFHDQLIDKTTDVIFASLPNRVQRGELSFFCMSLGAYLRCIAHLKDLSFSEKPNDEQKLGLRLRGRLLAHLKKFAVDFAHQAIDDPNTSDGSTRAVLEYRKQAASEYMQEIISNWVRQIENEEKILLILINRVINIYKEAKADWAACLIAELTLEEYYFMHLRSIREDHSGLPNDPRYIQRIGFVSMLLYHLRKEEHERPKSDVIHAYCRKQAESAWQKWLTTQEQEGFAVSKKDNPLLAILQSFYCTDGRYVCMTIWSRLSTYFLDDLKGQFTALGKKPGFRIPLAYYLESKKGRNGSNPDDLLIYAIQHYWIQSYHHADKMEEMRHDQD